MVRFAPIYLLLFTTPVFAQQPLPAQLLERAIYQEQAVGDLDQALKLYQEIITQHEQNEKVAAEARLHIGLIHLKRGDSALAAKVLQDLADKYPAQQSLLKQSRVQMPPIINEAIAKIRDNYVEEIDDDLKLTQSALKGVLGTLDRYSSYIDADTLDNMMIATSGKLVGVGAVIALEEGQVVVTAPLPGSPAGEAGLKPGDTILSVDGEKLSRFDESERLAEALKRIRGKSGKAVALEISTGSGQPRTVEITRRAIKLKSVVGVERDDDQQWGYRLPDDPSIGYVRIMTFSNEAPSDLRQVITELQSQNIEGLVIDLRNNGGGSLSASIEISDMFLSEGVMLDVRGRRSHNNTFRAESDELLKDVPIAILVNRNTASAAEIFAGAMSVAKRAVIIGERTFGKGTVQALFPLRSGGAIKLTTARFYLADGSMLEKPLEPKEGDTWGIDPTEGYTVELSDEDLEAYTKAREFVEAFGNPKEPAQPFTDRALEKAEGYLKSQP